MKLFMNSFFLRLMEEKQDEGGVTPPPEEKKEEQETKSTAETLKEIKENTVSKEKYEKLQKDFNDVVKSVLNGDGVNKESKGDEPSESIDDLRKDLFNTKGNLSNLEFAEKALALRESLMKEGKPDPFLPSGTNVDVTDEDIKKANNVAEAMKHCIEFADGDSDVFTAEFMRITKDVQLPKSRMN